VSKQQEQYSSIPGVPDQVRDFYDRYPYPRPVDRPWPFSGGSIKQVVVDVSGEAYEDLEKEAIGMMKRD
jgi:hypothetical protein